MSDCVRHDCELLRNRYPDARIILLTPLQTTAAPADRIRQAGDIIEQCGREMGFSVIRQDRELPVRAEQEKRQHTLTIDGTHTNEAGARQNGCLIARRVNDLLLTELKN